MQSILRTTVNSAARRYGSSSDDDISPVPFLVILVALAITCPIIAFMTQPGMLHALSTIASVILAPITILCIVLVLAKTGSALNGGDESDITLLRIDRPDTHTQQK